MWRSEIGVSESAADRAQRGSTAWLCHAGLSTFDPFHRHRLLDKLDLAIGGEEGDVGGVTAGADASGFGRARHPRRIDHMPVAIQIDFGPGGEILRPDATRIRSEERRVGEKGGST